MRAAFRTLATLTLSAWGFSFWGVGTCIWCRGLGWGMWGFFRVLVFLVIVVSSQRSFATDYYWTVDYLTGQQFSSASAACSAWFSADGRGSLTSLVPYGTSGAIFWCGSGDWYPVKTYRGGDSCPAGGTYNPSTGACDAPLTCPETDIYAAVSCTYVEASKLWSCPGEVSQDGCGFVTSPNGNNRCDSSTSICVNRYTGTGEAAGTGADPCGESTCAAAPTASEPACTTYEGTSICISDENTGCGTINGVEGCFTPDQNCGTYNGVFGCYPQDKPNRNCGYANGEQICFDPDNPTVQIPSTSPDHPINGGNADGNENNDPKDPADTSGTSSAQGTDSGATNGAIAGLGEKLGPKIDKTNSLLASIKDFLGVEYDSSAEWSYDQATEAGTALGQAMKKPLEDTVEETITARDAEIQTALSDIPVTVGSWFSNVPGIQSLGGFFPAASGCSDYRIPIDAMGFSFVVTLPVCFLSRARALIEWVLWCLTAIGVWNIFYSGLRLENAKASKGGY